MDFADQPGYRPISEGLKLLAEEDLLVGHNIIDFDLKAIKKVYPEWSTKALIRDTIVLVRLIWPHIKRAGFQEGGEGRAAQAAHRGVLAGEVSSMRQIAIKLRRRLTAYMISCFGKPLHNVIFLPGIASALF
jgi:hypothetical protein